MTGINKITGDKINMVFIVMWEANVDVLARWVTARACEGKSLNLEYLSVINVY